MEVTTERQENCIVKLTVAVDEEREGELLRRAARSLSRNYRIHGFRPGKAPYSVVVNRLGLEAVRAQVLDQFGEEVFQQGLEKSELQPADQASLEDVTWEPLTLHLTVPVNPEVTMGDVRALRIPWEEPEVSEDDLNEELLRLQKGQREWRPDNRPAELEDQVVLDITGTVDGSSVLENVDRELILDLDAPYPVPGFAAEIIGMKPEETREFDLVYPEDHYNSEVAGKEAHFRAYLKEIKVEVLPQLDDEFAMSVGDYEGLDDLKTQVQQSLLEDAQKAAEDAYEEKVWEQLLETASIEYPQVLVDREVEATQERVQQQLTQQGVDLPTYYQLTNTSEEAWKAEVRPQAEERVRRRLVIAQFIRDEEIEPEEGELVAEVDRLVEPMGDRADELRAALASPGGRITVAEGIVMRKAVELLKSIARGQEPEKTAEAAEAEEPASEAEAAIDAEAAEAEEAPSEAEAVKDTEAAEAEEAPSEAHIESEPASQAPAPSGTDEETPSEESGEEPDEADPADEEPEE